MKNDKEYYNPVKILSIKDMNGRDPSVRFICGNRTAGKSFSMKKVDLQRSIRKGRKFIYLIRNIKYIKGRSAAFFKDIGALVTGFKGAELTERKLEGCGDVKEWLYNGVPCGYCVALNQHKLIKEISSMFIDVDWILFDEFQPEDNRYLPGEVSMFESIRVSVARGGGEHVRHVETVLVSNLVSVINPYFIKYGITNRIRLDTKYMRGDGWVLEQTYNAEAAAAMREEHRDMKGSRYFEYMTGENYLVNTDSFTGRVKGQKIPYMTIVSGRDNFGVWDCGDVIYVSTHYDPDCEVRAVFTTGDHGEETILMNKSTVIVKELRRLYDSGAVRFENAKCMSKFFDICGLAF